MITWHSFSLPSRKRANALSTLAHWLLGCFLSTLSASCRAFLLFPLSSQSETEANFTPECHYITSSSVAKPRPRSATRARRDKFRGPACIDSNIRTVNWAQTTFVHRVVHMDLGRHDTFYGNSESTNRRCERTLNSKTHFQQLKAHSN